MSRQRGRATSSRRRKKWVALRRKRQHVSTYLAPTLDPGRVKRAYFAQLQAHPPHVDPEGFRQVRTAYEQLTAPGALPLAFVAVPVDVASELSIWRDRWAAGIDSAAAQVRRAFDDDCEISTFVETISRLGLSAAVEMFRDTKHHDNSTAG
jgi:hypothetical protein